MIATDGAVGTPGSDLACWRDQFSADVALHLAKADHHASSLDPRSTLNRRRSQFGSAGTHHEGCGIAHERDAQHDQEPRRRGLHRDRCRQHGGVRVLPVSFGARALRQPRDPRVDGDGRRRNLPRPGVRKAVAAGASHRWALRLHPPRIRRLHGLPHRLGLLDLDLGLAAGDRAGVCRRDDEPVPGAARQGDRRGADHRLDLGGGAGQHARRRCRRACSPR